MMAVALVREAETFSFLMPVSIKKCGIIHPVEKRDNVGWEARGLHHLYDTNYILHGVFQENDAIDYDKLYYDKNAHDGDARFYNDR